MCLPAQQAAHNLERDIKGQCGPGRPGILGFRQLLRPEDLDESLSEPLADARSSEATVLPWYRRGKR